MSPRRRIAPADRDYFAYAGPAHGPLRWGLPVTSLVTALLAALTIALCSFMLASHVSDRRTEVRDASALGSVETFMADYMTLDPFHANDYADRIAAQGTGEFAEQFTTRMNEIVVQVARAEPTVGTVLAAGVQRWNDDGSADVLVATKIASRTSDGTGSVESGSRWVVTTTEEGQQWKISRLTQVL